MKKLLLALFSLCALALSAGEVTVLKQFLPSIQGVSVPAGTKIGNVAVYAVKEDGQVNKEQPLPVKVIANADGSTRLLIEVPGLGSCGMAYAKIVDGIVYNNYHTPKNPPRLGPIPLTLQIDLNAPAASPALVATDANLMYNSDFEKPNAKGDFADGYLWQGLSQKGFRKWLKGEGYKGSAGIKIHRTAASGTAAFSDNYYIQGGKTYTFGGYYKCENPDKKYIIAFLQCFDKNGKPLLKEKGCKTYCYQKYATTDWGRFEAKVTLPENAFYVQFSNQMSAEGANNTLWIDNLFLKGEDIPIRP